MHGKLSNNLIVIENGQLSVYALDDKLVWAVGRPSNSNQPDIKLHSATVSREHGKFQNMDGIWFYIDNNGKNGTVYNDKHIQAGINGRVRPIMLRDGDVFVFGGGNETVINSKTIWAMYRAYQFDTHWRVADTKGMSTLEFFDGENSIQYQNPKKGTTVSYNDGMAIYMGDITYLSGRMSVVKVDT